MEHSLRPARELRSRLDTYPRVLVAILAKQKEKALPLFLRCIEELDYPKSSIVLYVRTNNNTDCTEQILRDWIARFGSSYAGVGFDAALVEEPVETFGQHEWNAIRFRVLGNIRNVSLSKVAECSCDYYFVCDADNFIRPCTLRELVALKLPIVAPLLRVTDANGYYSNFFAEIDPNGFYGHCEQYQWILQGRVRGVFEVPVVHCTYLVRADVIPRLRYLDSSDRYEFVVFSESARKAGIQQYIDNRQVYGYITFQAESDAAKEIVSEGSHDQIATAAIALDKVAAREPSRVDAVNTSPIASRLGLRAPPPEVFVINLDHRTDRWAAIEGTCRAVDLMPVRIPAIEASPAWRGCTLSHLKCIRLAKERNLPWVLILEDDATFTPETIDRFRGLLGYLWETREHWERFSGGPTLPTTNPVIRILSREPPLMYVPGLTTHFSLVHSDAYEMILTWDPECDPVIDMFYISLESRFRFRNIATVPHIAVQTTSRSDLTGSEMDSAGYYHFSEQKLRECLASGVVTDRGTSQIAIADEELTRVTERGSSHVEVRATREDAVELVNLALNKPAAQSSTSQWSKSPVAAEDARGANNGNISCEMGFHTDREDEPWWQVDLEGSYLIRKVVIFNRQEEAARLKHFSLFRSLDGTHWKRFFRKIDSTVFGDDADNRPYVAETAGNEPARFLRVRLDGHNYLHFKECQVFGDPLDPIALRRCMEEEARAEHERLELPDGRSGHMADVGGFTVFVDNDCYAPNIVFSLDRGLYEGGERQLTAELIRPTDRVIEAGTAIGVVSMTAAAIVGAESVLTFDANPEIVEDARQNFRRNGFCGIKSRIGVLKNRSMISRPDEIINFHIDAAFWTSRLDVSAATTGIVKTIQIPVFCLEDEICSHAANVLICDIEGGEADLLTQADLSGIRLIIMETHYWSAGEGPIDSMMNKLIREGFCLHLGYSGHHMVVLRR
jgi:FkbM family methyltransferase